MFNWDDLRLLLAVSRRGSFLQAGEMLGVAASTLSRRITQFEAAVGEPLIERGVDGVRLTPRGAVLVDGRTPEEFALGHLRHAINIGLEGRYAEFAGSVLPSDVDIVLLTEPGRELEGKNRLARIGFDRVIGYLAEPYQAMFAHEDDVQVASRLTAKAFQERAARIADLQIVDGGYAENFGLGTMVDLAPQLLEEVRAHNDCVLDPSTPRCDGTRAPTTLVAPMLVYLDNGTGSDLAVQPGGLDLEVLVPPLTLLSAKKELYSARSQLARAEDLFATDQLWDATATNADAARSAVDALRRSPVAIIFQATRPQVAGPLGWVLSTASMRSMDSALADLESPTPNELAQGRRADPLFDHTIGDVLAMLPGG